MTTHVPVTSPTTSTSHTSGTATAIGSGGTATAFGNSTTTTYGSQTSYVPMTVNRYDYGAAYFVKWRYILGAVWRDLTNEERTSLQSNSGIYITLVVDDTPAFRNDVLVEDIIVNRRPDDLWATSCKRHIDAETWTRGRANNRSQGTACRKEDQIS